jgi:hypothetical protein
MDFNSGFMDTLKLLLKDKYAMSDKDYMSLSGILLDLGLEDITEKGLLTALVYFMDKNNLRFPISYNFMKDLWEKSHLTASFKLMLSHLVIAKVVSLRKLNSETFFNSENINRHDIDLPGQDNYLVVYGTSLYKTLLQNISAANIMKDKLTMVGYLKVTEGVSFSSLDGKYKTFVFNILNQIRTKLFTTAKIESFEYDSIKNIITFNFVIRIPESKRNLKNKDLLRIFKKWVKDDFILDIDSSLDDEDNVFFSLSLDMRILSPSFKIISNNIAYAVDELMDIAQEGGTEE